MSLFGKNPNEVAYTGGKKHWADVIKNTGPGELLIWRQPEEDFNTNSTLIVLPGEQAIFIKGGNIEEVFENGTYKLSTENYPFISRLRNAFTGGISTFNCVVYFVRTADSAEILWGTTSKIQVRDKAWGIRTDVAARGAYKVRIENPALFLEKLIGNNVQFQTQNELNKYFSNEFQGKIKSAVSQFLNGREQELIGIDAEMDQLSEDITPYINDVVKEYGLKCVSFSLAGLDVDTTKYDVLDESQIAMINERRRAQGVALGQKDVMDILGEDWLKQQGVNILSAVANNPGAGSIGAMGAGMGMGMAAANVFNNIATQVFQPVNSPINPNDPVSTQPTPSGRFTQKNTPAEDSSSSQGDNDLIALEKLKMMLDKGLISQEQYDNKVQEILNRM